MWTKAFFVSKKGRVADGPSIGRPKSIILEEKTMKKTIRNLIAGAASLSLLLTLGACAAQKDTPAPAAAAAPEGETVVSAEAPGRVYHIGICNYVDDASLNQIVENIRTRLEEISAGKGVTFDVGYENCNADASVMNQIISNYISSGVDLMIGVATPVAMAMQAATEDNRIPVVFSAVSDPVGAELVESLDAPGANLTGTSDYLDTNAVMELIFAAGPEAETIGLLYDQGQDSSAAPIAHAKEYLDEKGIAYVERTGTTADEVMLAAQALVSDGVDAVFTPTDNTIMKSELAIYETFAKAGIPHYTGADSFALNGAFLGYGVDYANLGVETANMAASILLDGKDPASTPVMTFDNGTATVNTETCAALGFDYETIEKTFAPLCTKVQPIETAEEFAQ